MGQNRKKKISAEEARHNEEIEILSNFLSQRRKAKRRKAILEQGLMGSQALLSAQRTASSKFTSRQTKPRRTF